MQPEISSTPLHEIPDDLREILVSNPYILAKWNAITPLARNEWVCWLTIVKQEKTRKEHLERLQEELLEGKKRPCCWPGCPHRRPSAKKYFERRK
jgi:uncharacterized protein YdeI (YjbR/CyaY-like superfamily)